MRNPLLTLFFFISISLFGLVSTPRAQAAELNPDTGTDVEIASGALKGRYVKVGSETPIALIVPGSGPISLNGNIGTQMRSNVYKHLAYQLAAKGISSVRVDKRGMYSSADAGDPNAVTLDIYTQDYRAWVDTIKAQSEAKCVFLIGHSEGGLMVSSAAIDRNDICGLILISAPGRPMGVLLEEQLRANPANFMILKKALKAIRKLEAGERVETKNMSAALQGLFHESIQDYLITIMAVNPADMAARANQKTLIVQGDRDIQVSAADVKLLQNETGGTLVIAKKVNHVLKISPKGRLGNMKTYNDPDLPVADSVINAIVEFIHANSIKTNSKPR